MPWSQLAPRLMLIPSLLFLASLWKGKRMLRSQLAPRLMLLPRLTQEPTSQPFGGDRIKKQPSEPWSHK